jgi:hypothetical protein
MPSRKQHSGPPGRPARVSRRQADDAREQLAVGGLSHQERRKLRSVVRTRDEATDRRGLEFRHITIVVGGTLVAMAVVGALVGLVPAIEASHGQGTPGTFVAMFHSCRRHTGCAMAGTFQPVHGGKVPDVIYAGALPADAGPGMGVPAIRPGGSEYVYPPHGTLRWVFDLLLTLLLGAAVGFLLLASTLGLRGRKTSHPRSN